MSVNGKHSPGPWSVVPLNSFGPYAILMPTPPGTKHPSHYGVRHVGAEADAKLIAASPELLAAVRKAEQLASVASDWNLSEVEIDGQMVGIYALMAEFTAAIAKAGAA